MMEARRPSRAGRAAVKLLVGCAVLLALGIAGTATAIGIGGMALLRGLESIFGELDEHQKANRLLERLEREHPFHPPSDGPPLPAAARRFRAVTRHAWQGFRPWVGELRALSSRPARPADARAEPRGLLAGTRVLGAVTQSRLHLARALSREGNSLREYIWTGHTLARCDSASFSGQGWGDADPSLVLDLATMWAMSGGALADLGAAREVGAC